LSFNRIPKQDDAFVGIIFRYNKIDSGNSYYMVKIMPKKIELVKVSSKSENVVSFTEFEFRNVKKELGVWI